jgi:SAM-dependent methyltransferase
METTTPPFDRDKAERFLGQVVNDVGSALLGGLSYIGDRLGLFATLVETGPVTVDALAARTSLQPRYLREWLNAMTAAQYLTYDPATGQYHLPPEHATVLADESSPWFLGGFLELMAPAMSQAPKVLEAFRKGGGVPQADYPPEIFEAIERGTAPWYRHKLVREWLPAMPQVVQSLEAGGRAVDVGCGSGRAAIALALAFPRAQVHGYDNHPGSIERAGANARAAGVGDRVRFEVVDATRMPAESFDFISTFDVVHDAADPRGLVRAIRQALAPDGTYLMLEMNCAPRVDGNIHPIGKLIYSVSTLYCMTQSLAQGGEGLGAAMGEPTAREIAAQAGFTRFRKLPIDDPLSVLYELRS